MKIYFAANLDHLDRNSIAEKVIGCFGNAGVLVLSNFKQDNLFKFADQDLEKIDKSGELILTKIDAVAVDGGLSVSESSYLIALALTYKKPILYLVEKGKALDAHISDLSQNKSITKLLKVEFYQESSLEKIIGNFINEIEKGSGRELASIKFTLRITQKIERYLLWKTNNTKLSKADFIRERLEELMAQDENYKKYFENER